MDEEKKRGRRKREEAMKIQLVPSKRAVTLQM